MQHILAEILALDILLPPGEYLANILSVICTARGFTCGVAIDHPTDGGLPFVATHQMPKTVESPHIISALEALLRHLSGSEGAPAVVTLPITDAAELPASWQRFCRTQGIRTLLYVPLTHLRELQGAALFFHPGTWEASPEERLALQQIGELASVAVVNNQYLVQLQEQRKASQEEIARRKRTEEALREALRARKDLEDIITRSPVVVCRWLASGEYPLEFVSRNITQFGYSPDELCTGAVSFFDLVDPRDHEHLRAEIEDAVSARVTEFVLEYRMLMKNDEERWVENRVVVRRDTDSTDLLHVVTSAQDVVTHLQGVIHDISERKRAEEIIWHQAYHDTLTDLPNRTLFYDRLTVALAHARRYKQQLAVMFLDLDNFKNINDSMGHAAGDQLLREVSERLKRGLRACDTLARFGGDEFTVLLTDLKQTSDVAYVSQKILELLREPFVIAGQELTISTSIGISLFPDDAADTESLLQNADTALYQAKDQGRNQYHFFAPSMVTKTQEWLEMDAGLRHALVRDQFILHYQPQVDLQTGAITGMEALIRWQHPAMGLISPAKFIPIAEETGLIERIGHWVVRKVCEQNVAWQQAGLGNLRIAVNISARQFYREQFPKEIAQILQDTQLDPRYLVLEITEGLAVRNIEMCVEMMRELRALGIQLSLDDFGIGFSSLMYLKRFPLSTLKIDQMFVRGLTTDQNDLAITTAIIAMAHSMGLQVIAEGVEIDEQLRILCEHRCDGAQGYLISHPLPAVEIERHARSGFSEKAHGQWTDLSELTAGVEAKNANAPKPPVPSPKVQRWYFDECFSTVAGEALSFRSPGM
ncbi:MAG: putative bifunctional diguanylate cyclase/phosphodiesterase [Armatimonadota bacterium]